MFVYRGIFLNKRIRAWYVGFRLIVVVVGDEVFHRVFREEFFHLTIKLRCQRFVGCQHHRWALQISNDISNGEGFPRPRHTEQSLVREAILQPLFEAANRLRLIARRFERGIQFEWFTHESLPEGVGGQVCNFTRHD